MPSDAGSQEDTYWLGDSIPGDVPESVPRGTNLLVVGPPMVGKQRVTLRVLAEAPRHEQASVLVTTSTTAEKIEREYRECAPTDDLSHLRIIDATGIDAGGAEDAENSRCTHAVSSPADLTGIGIGITESAQAFDDRPIRLGFVSISMLLQYMDSERVFSFLHVLTNRVSQSGYLGVFTFDPDAHETRTLHAIKSLFDAVVAVEETDAGDPSATFVR